MSALAVNAIPVPACNFWPDETFFDSPRFSVSRLTHVLKAKAVLCPGVEITFKDEINNTEQRWCYQDGLNDYLAEAVNRFTDAARKTVYRYSLAILKLWTGRYCGCRKAVNC
ncbi:topoisomerase IV subunit B [Escherichia coli]|uniref:Topoisomerase IV subunit B n=1 Tax=Escherichia coli TaxID=562 RepID=A0A376UG82_ECOLX|nr:topoisomerase IV subunit B [Escherichia coli]